MIEILRKQAKYHGREFVIWAANDLRKEVQVFFLRLQNQIQNHLMPIN